MSQPSNSVGKAIVTALLIITGLGALAVTACGGIFTVAGIQAMLSSKGGGEFGGAFLVIAVPSLLVGGVITWLCFRAVRKASAAPPPAAPAEVPPGDSGQP